MDNYNIIIFLCNWSPHVAFQTLQDQIANISADVKMIRIPCSGRISKALLAKAFEKGADGVVLAGCKPGTCRYGSGTETAKKNTKDMRDILGLLGLSKKRMRFATFLPDESSDVLTFLNEFSADIRKLGISPVRKNLDQKDTPPASLPHVSDILAKHDVFACQECGKCTSACPLALTGKPFSPRAIASAVINGKADDRQVREDVSACLTCGICYERCPSAVNFPEFIQDMRNYYATRNMHRDEAHGGFFQSIMRIMTTPELKFNRWKWLPEDVHVDPKSNILFYGGCAPYFDIFFNESSDPGTRNIIADSIRLLNFFDVRPMVLSNERCCGHDLLWTGDTQNFLRLAALSVEQLEEKGIEEVITSCPECYRTLAYEYPKHGISFNFKVTHIYDWLEHEIDKGAIDFKPLPRRATFQDSCRLTQAEEIRNMPRKLIERLNLDQFTEMQNSGKSALCCGNSAWSGCDSYSKALQVKRIRQAHDTESDLLITACPKCQLHLRCAMQDPFLGESLKIEMLDLTRVLVETICWE